MKARRSSKYIMKMKIYCDDHSSLSSTTAVQYEFHIYFTSFHCTGRYEINKLTWLNFWAHDNSRDRCDTHWQKFPTFCTPTFRFLFSIPYFSKSWQDLPAKSEEWSSQSIFQFKQLAGRKKPEKYQGFNGIRTRDLPDIGAMLDQLSCEATYWELSQFVEFISSRAVKWCEKCVWNSYCTAVVDESEVRSSQLSWSSIAPVSRRSRVRIPLNPWYFSGFFLPIA